MILIMATLVLAIGHVKNDSLMLLVASVVIIILMVVASVLVEEVIVAVDLITAVILAIMGVEKWWEQ